MPYVNIKLIGPLTREQKQKIAKGVTDVISEVANKPKEAVLLFIDEAEKDDVAKAGTLVGDM
ncbi:MAG: 4-oxalocrotonate tautomerase [Desulfobulbus propionicus]|nr:MAG: 4-oxalocrotonate tautomerase [Desulfobulbus propionicus]